MNLSEKQHFCLLCGFRGTSREMMHSHVCAKRNYITPEKWDYTFPNKNIYAFKDSKIIIDTPYFRVVKRWDGSYAYGCGAEQTTELSNLLKECLSNDSVILDPPIVVKTLPDGFVYLIECPYYFGETFLHVMSAILDDITNMTPISEKGENNES